MSIVMGKSGTVDVETIMQARVPVLESGTLGTLALFAGHSVMDGTLPHGTLGSGTLQSGTLELALKPPLTWEECNSAIYILSRESGTLELALLNLSSSPRQ